MEFLRTRAQIFHYQMFCGGVADDLLVGLVYTWIVAINGNENIIRSLFMFEQIGENMVKM